jgi:hypothetical protein
MQSKRRPSPDQRYSYFVVMIDYGRRGCEAVVNPEVTRREVISRLISREYDAVRFIHHIVEGEIPRDVTLELQLEASSLAMAEAA